MVDLEKLHIYDSMPKEVPKPDSLEEKEQKEESAKIEMLRRTIPDLELMDEATGASSPDVWNAESMRECRRVRDLIGEYNESLLKLRQEETDEKTPENVQTTNRLTLE
jgi:hypothetical protein